VEGGGRTGAGGAIGTGGVASGGMSGGGGSSAVVTFPRRFVGNIDGAGSIREDFATQWDQFTPENAGKWASVQATAQGTFNWTSLDAMYKYAEDHNIVFKEHCFVWGAAQPAWQGNLDTTTGPAAVKNWMKAFCDRYPKTRLIDVVNEPPPHTTPPYVNAIGGGSRTTWDWIANSFKWAREACPNAILILNDYDNAEYASDVQNTIDIVNAIKALGAPIDAIGCQAHDASKVPASTLKANIDKIASSTGLPVYITEYDIGISDDDLQKQKYEEDFTMFWDNPNVKGVTVWGYIVGRTWRTSTGIMQSDGTMRPAMSWLMDFLGR
jgi:endo-1,4-beta-xylanase